jgi:hypothetical protein
MKIKGNKKLIVFLTAAVLIIGTVEVAHVVTASAAQPSPPTGVTVNKTTPDGVIMQSAAQPLCGMTTAAISWTAGQPYTSYTATSSPDVLTATVAGNPANNGVIVSGLSLGTTYTFTVTSTNASGTSAPSTVSNSITPYACPPPPSPSTQSPTGVVATIKPNPLWPTSTCGSLTYEITWDEPANGGWYVYYTATSSPGGIQGTAELFAPPWTLKLGGGTYDTTYTFTVTVGDGSGNNATSALSNSITPIRCPLP